MQKKCARVAAVLLAFALFACLFALPAGAAGEQTLEAMFSGYTGGGRSNLSLKLEGDTATFSYSPLFHVERNFPGYAPLTDGDVAWIVDQCVAGFKLWEGEYAVRGRTLTLVVDVDAKMAANSGQANVRVMPRGESSNAGSASFSALFWNPGYTTTINLRPNYPMDEMYYLYVGAHEFGHALGLNDAYSYANRFDSSNIFGWFMNMLYGFAQPAAPYDRAPYDAIMRTSWYATIYDRDAEMVLWAWRNGRFQLYSDSIMMYLSFWFEVSPAFFY